MGRLLRKHKVLTSIKYYYLSVIIEIYTIVRSGILINGLFEAVPKLCEGVDYKLIIPPHMAYGEWGIEDYVAGSVVLHADVTIHESWPPIDAAKIALCDEEPKFEGNSIEKQI